MKKISYIMAALAIAAFLGASASGDTPELNPERTKGGSMVRVPAGKFKMGCNDQLDKKCGGDEKPFHEVELDEYFIDKLETTNWEYQKCVDEGKCIVTNVPLKLNAPDQPMVNVRWEQAKIYCEWAGKRLPTEAEWEKAARGDDGRTYPWGEVIDCKKAQTAGCKPNATLPVGKLVDGASPYGALDMAGNAAEWVADWYDNNYYKKSPAKNPTGPDWGLNHMVKGGSFDDNAKLARASARTKVVPAVDYTYNGFRCAFTPK